MEKRVDSIVFRRVTYADFRHINKVGGEEAGGGGQSYIDFPIANIDLDSWYTFLGAHTSEGAGNRPKWDFQINSLSLNTLEDIRIYQRRSASISIASQKLPEHSRGGKRIAAWHPNNSFPVDYNPDVDNLVIYIIKSTDNDFWAGWFLKQAAPKNWLINDDLDILFEEEAAGIIIPNNKILFDTEIKEWPFYFDAQTIKNQLKSDEDIEDDLLNQDTSPKLAEISDDEDVEVKERIFKIRKRNNKIVKELST